MNVNTDHVYLGTEKEGRHAALLNFRMPISEKTLKSCHFSEVVNLSALLCLKRPSQGREGPLYIEGLLRKRELQGLEKTCLQHNTQSAARSA